MSWGSKKGADNVEGLILIAVMFVGAYAITRAFPDFGE